MVEEFAVVLSLQGNYTLELRSISYLKGSSMMNGLILMTSREYRMSRNISEDRVSKTCIKQLRTETLTYNSYRSNSYYAFPIKVWRDI